MQSNEAIVGGLLEAAFAFYQPYTATGRRFYRIREGLKSWNLSAITAKAIYENNSRRAR